MWHAGFIMDPWYLLWRKSKLSPLTPVKSKTDQTRQLQQLPINQCNLYISYRPVHNYQLESSVHWILIVKCVKLTKSDYIHCNTERFVKNQVFTLYICYIGTMPRYRFKPVFFGQFIVFVHQYFLLFTSPQ